MSCFCFIYLFLWMYLSISEFKLQDKTVRIRHIIATLRNLTPVLKAHLVIKVNEKRNYLKKPAKSTFRSYTLSILMNISNYTYYFLHNLQYSPMDGTKHLERNKLFNIPITHNLLFPNYFFFICEKALRIYMCYIICYFHFNNG